MFLVLCETMLPDATVAVLVTILHMGSYKEVSLLKEKQYFVI